MTTFLGRTADQVWQQLYQATMPAGGTSRIQSSRAGDTLELLHVAFEIQEPVERWVVSRRPAVNPAFAIAEAISLLAGNNKASVLNFWNSQLPKFAGDGTIYPGAYGYRLRHQFGFDQLRRAYEALAANPDSRQVVLQIWDVTSDLPEEDGLPRSMDVPCNLCSILKVREDRLEWTQIMRSTDIHRGLPYNVVQFTLIQEIMAGWLGVKVGSYHHWSDSLHAYCDALRTFSCEPCIDFPRSTDSLATGITQGEIILAELFQRLVALSEPTLSESRVGRLSIMPDVPIGYGNLLRILGAESARRRGYSEVANEIVSACTNPQLVHTWTAWSRRSKPHRRPQRVQV